MTVDINKRIKRLSEEAGVGPTELANACGVTRAAVYKWMESAEPKISQIAALAKALKTDPSYLAFGRSAVREPLDEETLIAIIVELENSFIETGASLPPEAKAHLIVNLYKRAKNTT